MPKELTITHSGWLRGDRVQLIPSHPSWYYATDPLETPDHGPAGLVAHYTATKPGTGLSMALRRQGPFGPGDRAASWHVTVTAAGEIIQQIPLIRGAWHCRRTVASDRILDSITQTPVAAAPNRCLLGVEFEGSGEFTEAQAEAAELLWLAVWLRYRFPSAGAVLHHSALDPERRSDPGPGFSWVEDRILDALRRVGFPLIC